LRTVESIDALAGLVVADQVRIKDHARPRYLEGLRATVELRRKRANARRTRWGAWAACGPITVLAGERLPTLPGYAAPEADTVGIGLLAKTRTRAKSRIEFGALDETRRRFAAWANPRTVRPQTVRRPCGRGDDEREGHPGRKPVEIRPRRLRPQNCGICRLSDWAGQDSNLGATDYEWRLTTSSPVFSGLLGSLNCAQVP
jgi:hypothetical protein